METKKIALGCDTILKRDLNIQVLEEFIQLYPDSEVYTYAHRPGAVIGPVEQRKIHSSYLSHFVERTRDFWKKSGLIPGASKKLFISCENDLVIHISSGFSHMIRKCEKSYQITYLIDHEIFNRRKGGIRERFFRPYLKNWSMKGLKKSDELWVATKEQAKFYSSYHPKVSILPLCFNVGDFPLFPDSQRKVLSHGKVLVGAEALDVKSAIHHLEELENSGLSVLFVGRDDHLVGKDPRLSEKLFFGDRCTGELAPLLAGAKCFLYLGSHIFPDLLLKSLCVGTPILAFSQVLSHLEIEGEGVFSYSNSSEILEKIKGLPDLGLWDTKKTRAHVMKFHDVKFRAEISRRVESILSRQF